MFLGKLTPALGLFLLERRCLYSKFLLYSALSLSTVTTDGDLKEKKDHKSNERRIRKHLQFAELAIDSRVFCVDFMKIVPLVLPGVELMCLTKIIDRGAGLREAGVIVIIEVCAYVNRISTPVQLGCLI